MSQAQPDNEREQLTDLLSFLAETSDKLADFATTLTDEELRQRSSPELFSTLENICHLRDLELQGYTTRIERILNENQPSLADFDGTRVAAEGNYNSEDLDRALAAFRTARDSNIEKLKRAADAGGTPAILKGSANELSRTGVLEGVGLVTLPRLAELMREHDEGHLDDLRVLQHQLERRRLSDASEA